LRNSSSLDVGVDLLFCLVTDVDEVELVEEGAHLDQCVGVDVDTIELSTGDQGLRGDAGVSFTATGDRCFVNG
jgi:hypothetical protein